MEMQMLLSQVPFKKILKQACHTYQQVAAKSPLEGGCEGFCAGSLPSGQAGGMYLKNTHPLIRHIYKTLFLATACLPLGVFAQINTSLEHYRQYNGNITGIHWKTASDSSEQLYTYSYDTLNRLKRADYVAYSGTNYDENAGYFSLASIRYDQNGNIQSLTRQGMNDTGNAAVIDELTYTYNTTGHAANQLINVTDTRGPEGFSDSTHTSNDYTYDPNGNLVKDLNKGIDSIYYNHLNLPLAIVLSPSGGGTGEEDSIAYLYDAAGIKLQQKEYKADTLYRTTDYIGANIYISMGQGDPVLQQVQHDEGRIAFTSGGHAEPVEADYQYHLTDHLGNIRVIFSTTPEQYTLVEDFEEDPATSTGAFTDLKNTTDQNANTTQPLASNNKTSLLQNGQTSALIMLHVNKGDTIDLSVNASYTQDPVANTFTPLAFSALFGSYNAAIAGGEAPAALANEFDDALSGVGMVAKSTSTDPPNGFLNYILFDEGMNYVTAGFTEVTTAAYRTTPNHSEQISIHDIIADQEGYILAYLSNENLPATSGGSDFNVYFDDFTVIQSKTNVVSTADYYPYGLTFNNYERTGLIGTNKYFYQGKEYLGEEGLDVYDFHARYYDPALGRFTSVDPQNQFMSGYVGMGNMPTIGVDPDGEFVFTALALIAAPFTGGASLSLLPYTIGADIGTWQGGTMANGTANPFKWDYSSGKTWGYMAGGAVTGALSGGAANAVATSGMPFANTAAIMTGSYINSFGTKIYTGGQSDFTIGFGVASYNFDQNELGYLGKKGNSTLENIGYGLGALANAGDILAGFQPSEVQLNTENSDAIGHSALTKVGETDAHNSLVSVGPDPGGKWIFNPFKFKKGTNDWKNYVDAGDDVSKVTVKGINLKRITKYGARLDKGVKYNLYCSSCVNHTARALTIAGAPSIGIHPFILNAQMYMRSLGVRPSLFSYHLYNSYR